MATQPKDRFSLYQYGEGRTGIGQAVEFSCPSGEIDTVRAFLLENVRTIRPPMTHKVATSHGWFVGCSRYDVKQHEYAGGRSGFIEVLEIADAPDERCGIVCYEYSSYGSSSFTEWDTVEHARAAHKTYFSGGRDKDEKIAKLPGFKRHVQCGVMTPWFYAIGDEELVGDYTFPHGLQDDPTYRFGRRFVVSDWQGIPSIKTCMGTRFVRERSSSYPYTEEQYRIIYWNDGSTWKEGSTARDNPRPVEDDELWIVEAVQQFRELLAGKRTEFFIKLTDGNQFVGKLARVNRRNPCAEGKYSLTLNIKGEAKPMQGYVDFKPTPEAPDVVQFAIQGMAKRGKEVERVQVDRHESFPNGKKWAGVYFSPSKP